MNDSYRDMEFTLYGNLVQMKNIISYYNKNDPVLSNIEAGIRQIRSKRYNVAVMGEFKRGKSSLINALLGMEILPADVTPTTATVNRITFGTESKAVINFKDGNKKEVKVADLCSYVTKLTEGSEKTASTVKEAVIYYPTVICQNHIDIIDTPGLSDDADMTKVTISTLENIDAAIVAVSALSPFSQTEADFTAQLLCSPNVHNVIFVVTFIDQVDEDDFPRLFEGIQNRISTMSLKAIEQVADKDDVAQKAQRLLQPGAVNILFVSAKKALQAFMLNDAKLLRESNFPIFRQELHQVLTAQQSMHMVDKAYSIITETARHFDEIYRVKFETITGHIDRIRAAIETVNAYFDGNAAYLDGLHKKFSERAAESIRALENTELLSAYIRNLHKVRQNDPQVIKSAVLQGEAEALAVASAAIDTCCSATKSWFEETTADMAQRREKNLYQPVTMLNAAYLTASDTFFKHLRGEINQFALPAYMNRCALVPDGVNLAHYNIIYHIENVTRTSWSGFINDIRTAIERLWERTAVALDADIAMRAEALKKLEAQYADAEISLLVCKANYQLHKDMIEMIASETTSLFDGRLSDKEETQ